MCYTFADKKDLSGFLFPQISGKKLCQEEALKSELEMSIIAQQ